MENKRLPIGTVVRKYATSKVTYVITSYLVLDGVEGYSLNGLWIGFDYPLIVVRTLKGG